ARLREQFPETSIAFVNQDFIDYAIQAEMDHQKFDLVIGNPPYIRIQGLDQKTRQKIVSRYGLSGRMDLAFAFILAAIRLLAKDGRAAIITSNRILSTDAGKPVRQTLLEATHVREIWDLGDTRL